MGVWAYGIIGIIGIIGIFFYSHGKLEMYEMGVWNYGIIGIIGILFRRGVVVCKVQNIERKIVVK